MESHTIDVDGIRVRWEERGEGVPVVLVHGIPTSPALWRDVAPRLEGARVLAWEMVGYGASIPEGRDRDISVGRQASYLTAWLRTLGIERAVLGGHDLGGGVVQIAAVRHPELCSGLFLTNAVGYDAWPVPPVKALRALGALIEHGPDAFVRLIMRTLMRLGHDTPTAASEALELHWRHYAEHDAARALVRQIRSLHVEDTLAVRDALPELGVPARVVWGAADIFLKVRYGEYFAHDLGTPLRRIPRGRHFTPEDHPGIVANALNELVREAGAD